LDQHIVCADALFADWPKANAIIGNLPFLTGYKIRGELGDKYADRLSTGFPEIKDKTDFCTYWFRLAHKSIEPNSRAGLVGTNSISQGISRKASLEFTVEKLGYIHDAISTYYQWLKMSIARCRR
jgi:hypothetical protein